MGAKLPGGVLPGEDPELKKVWEMWNSARRLRDERERAAIEAHQRQEAADQGARTAEITAQEGYALYAKAQQQLETALAKAEEKERE